MLKTDSSARPDMCRCDILLIGASRGTCRRPRSSGTAASGRVCDGPWCMRCIRHVSKRRMDHRGISKDTANVQHSMFERARPLSRHECSCNLAWERSLNMLQSELVVFVIMNLLVAPSSVRPPSAPQTAQRDGAEDRFVPQIRSRDELRAKTPEDQAKARRFDRYGADRQIEPGSVVGVGEGVLPAYPPDAPRSRYSESISASIDGPDA